mmetsp:Transcript_3341/g.7012  ORF Transcript_3341/g.7012 Transcript_3341/m.7012 type:complete len:95 (+) Transcript_3341:2-286(+)
MLTFGEARRLARSLRADGPAAFAGLKAAGEGVRRTEPDAWNGGHALRTCEAAAGPDLGRLPAKPDLYYRDEWQGWDDFLGLSRSDREAAAELGS